MWIPYMEKFNHYLLLKLIRYMHSSSLLSTRLLYFRIVVYFFGYRNYIFVYLVCFLTIFKFKYACHNKDASIWAKISEHTMFWKMQLTDFSFIQSPPEVHANAAETLCTVTRNAPSPLAAKLSSPRFDFFYICSREYVLSILN